MAKNILLKKNAAEICDKFYRWRFEVSHHLTKRPSFTLVEPFPGVSIVLLPGHRRFVS